jgi:hypothetical protein
MVRFTPQLLCPHGKSPWYPLDRRLGGSQSRSGRQREKNSQPLLGFETPIIQLVAQRYTTEQSRLIKMQVDRYIYFARFIFILPSPSRGKVGNETEFGSPEYLTQEKVENHNHTYKNVTFISKGKK